MAKQPATQVLPASAHPPWYSRYGNCAQIASAVFAAVGFSFVIWQIAESRHKTSEEAYRTELSEARKVYMSYSNSTLQIRSYRRPTMPRY